MRKFLAFQNTILSAFLYSLIKEWPDVSCDWLLNIKMFSIKNFNISIYIKDAQSNVLEIVNRGKGLILKILFSEGTTKSFFQSEGNFSRRWQALELMDIGLQIETLIIYHSNTSILWAWALVGSWWFVQISNWECYWVQTHFRVSDGKTSGMTLLLLFNVHC